MHRHLGIFTILNCVIFEITGNNVVFLTSTFFYRNWKCSHYKIVVLIKKKLLKNIWKRAMNIKKNMKNKKLLIFEITNLLQRNN